MININDKTNDVIAKIIDVDCKQSAQNMLDWLAANKVSLGGKYKDKRWGAVGASRDGGWFVHVNVQYDAYLDEFLSNETDGIKSLARTQTGHMGCPRCKTGKCQFTGTDIANPDEEQTVFVKKLILYRIHAIKEGRVPKCSYVKVSRRGEALEPCAVHKVCDPKCRAMKNP